MSFGQLSRRNFIKSIALAGGMILQAPLYGYRHSAFGSPCPQLSGRQVLWVVPFGPGGGYDAYSRLIAPFLAGRIGATVRVENVTGGSGVLGSIKISEAVPNGRTIGLINGAGLLIASLTGVANTPNPLAAFSILGRIARVSHIWVTGADSKLKTMGDVFGANSKRPILFGVGEVAGTMFTDVSIASSLLNINSAYVAGYKGTRESSMAAIRGDVDIVALPFATAFDRIEAGGLRPLLQISDDEIDRHPVLKGVPLLGGDEGLVAQRAAEAGLDVGEAASNAAALIGLLDAGRLVAAPAGLDADLRQCLEDGLFEAMTDPSFVKAAGDANRTLDIARGSTAREGIVSVVGKAEKLTAIYKTEVKKVRG